MPLHMDSLTMLVALGSAALLLISSARFVRPRRSLDARYRRKSVLTPWERKALGILARQLRPGLHLCPQVRLADMLSIDASDRSLYFRALNQVACKSVDFVVADVVTGAAVLVIELDDRSHRREDRQARDVLVDAVLREAGIPIVRFKPSQRLDLGPALTAAVGARASGMKIAAE
jgi:very-short-patch-repair endonuclease